MPIHYSIEGFMRNASVTSPHWGVNGVLLQGVHGIDVVFNTNNVLPTIAIASLK